MRIGIDLTHAYQRNGGIPRYALELTRALLKIDQDNEYVLFFRGEPRPELAEYRVETYVSPVRHQVVSEQTWLCWAARRARLDLLHLTGFAGPLAYFKPAVITVHDMTQFLYPETMKWVQWVYWRWLFPITVRRSSAIITISENSRKNISRVLNLPQAKIIAIPEACSPIFFEARSPHKLEEVARRHNLPPKFFLVVGTLEPRKNHSRLLEAYAQLRESVDALPHLVFAGRPGWLYDQTLQRIKQLGLSDYVKFIGAVSDHDLCCTYRLTEALLFPSIYEGFGLPILEAMASGCPVMTSNTSAMPEVAADAAEYVDPLNIPSIAKGILAILDPHRKKELLRRGFSRIKDFSWDLTARKTLSIYQAVAVQSPF
jgi:glycosyltransferase involved in cell wall biosynthesis